MFTIQVPFEFAVQNVLEQLKKISKGDYKSPITERRKSATIVYAAVSLPVQDIQDALHTVSEHVYEPLWLPQPVAHRHFYNMVLSEIGSRPNKT